MTKITYDARLLKLMNLFEKITKANLKDCFIDDNSLLTFIVKENEIGKAIGKNARNVKKLERLLKRKIKIVEYSSNVTKFVKNLVSPLKPDEIVKENSIIKIKSRNTRTKGLLIGKNSKNLKNNIKITKKYFKIKDIKVI
ncbi:NusA-like transcription termination signal-binding factor [Candidatus Woesearchaeota archaeon]|nr:NusA-like transcription termination signal-binding factor [Candidatus Woesearchaeota archaeon]